MPDPAAGRCRPFHCGTQMGDWDARNCDRCAKVDYDARTSRCDIYDAICAGYIGDGTVSREIAERMGLPGNECALTWDCPEREIPQERREP